MIRKVPLNRTPISESMNRKSLRKGLARGLLPQLGSSREQQATEVRCASTTHSCGAAEVTGCPTAVWKMQDLSSETPSSNGTDH